MDWRSWSQRERALLRDLALMLALMLVVGVYFLERLDTRLQAQHRQHLQALVSYLARDSAEYLSAGNRVSLGVIARQAVELDTVETLVIRDMKGRELARSGPSQPDSAPVQQAVGESGASPLGRVSLWPEPDTVTHEGVEAGFVLVALLLLVLRVLAEVIRRHLWPAGPEGVPAVPTESDDRAPTSTEQAWLRIAVVNLDWMRERYTGSALNSLLAEHQKLLDRVAELYGGHSRGRLGDEPRVVFAAATAAEAAFQALCASQVFCLAEQQSCGSGLQFRILLTTVDRADESGLCAAAQPGRIHVPAQELTPLELDSRALYDPEQALEAATEHERVILQPLDQLVQRYQRLVTAQAEKLQVGGSKEQAESRKE